MAKITTLGKGKLYITTDHQAMAERIPMSIDGLACRCGGQTFRLGLAPTSKPCKNCGTHLVHQCARCDSWFCTTCLVRSIVEHRNKVGEDNLGVLSPS